MTSYFLELSLAAILKRGRGADQLEQARLLQLSKTMLNTFNFTMVDECFNLENY